jgi:pimeloyl-ACP methyl ester carboxylesterase
VPETSYASCGDHSLAYQVFGDGPVELVFVGPMVSHVELFWTLPEFKAFFDQLATFCRVLVFDKAGIGLSDPVAHVRTVDDRASEIEAVMDAVGFGEAVLFGVSEGGPASIVFAAKRPERTRALILYGSNSFFPDVGWDDVDRDPAELRASVASTYPEVDEKYWPSTKQIVGLQELGRAIGSGWGSGAAATCMFPSVRSMRQLAMLERMSASPSDGAGILRSGFPDRRAIDPADDHRTHSGHPCPRRRRRSGAMRPVSRRPHPRWAIPGGRRRGPHALAHRPGQDLDRDRGVPHRQPCRAGAVPSRPAHRAVHRHRRLHGTRRGDRRRAVAGAAPALW